MVAQALIRKSGTKSRLLTARDSADDLLWYRDAIIYELHVRAFSDSNADGIGDFVGLTQKLDYLHDLGVTAIWLLPFYPSPLKDDGYDIAEYRDVHPAYGTLKDFKFFLREAHDRGLRVITELVVNHTSDQHPWFARARRARPGSQERDFYVWTNDPERFKETRIIFKDFETSNWAWDPVASAYYWHRFYSHQPDLNFDNPAVRRAVFNAMDFWLGMGVDGLRLDAIPYLYEREGTNCENLPETHRYLKQLRARVDAKYKGRMLLGEANQWPEDSVAYFGDGDECHMAFHFPLMPRLFMAIRTEDRFPIVDILNQTPSIPETNQWALFLRNHDELTLEMVTDEERDYMYRVYASDPQARINLGIRRRLAPLLGNNRRKIELMNGLLLSLPGTPVLYYGDEIGMGDNIYLGDRNGVRTPMQWAPDRNAGFSRANPQKLYLPVIIDPEYHYEALNVEAQQSNPHSLFSWTKRLLAIRKHSKAFGRGSFQIVSGSNPKVIAYLREYDDERILVVANLSRFTQGAKLDLSDFQGSVPTEVFGQSSFPVISTEPYFLSLGPHNFFWFRLTEPGRQQIRAREQTALQLLHYTSHWKEIVHERAILEAVLASYLPERRWFGGKARTITGTRIEDAVTVPYSSRTALVCLVTVTYLQGDPERYLIPLTASFSDSVPALLRGHADAVIARVQGPHGEGLLHDALVDPDFCESLLALIRTRRRLRGSSGEMGGFGGEALRLISQAEDLSPSGITAEQSNSSVTFGKKFILKVYRRVEEGINPDLEIGKFLTDKGFTGTPPVVGHIEYRADGRRSTIGVLQEYVSNQGDAWQYAADVLGRYFERVFARSPEEQRNIPMPGSNFIDAIDGEIPEQASGLIGTFLESARLLGLRTAEMHLLLASEAEHPDFKPEPYTTLSQRSMYQSLRNLANQTFDLIRQGLADMPPKMRAVAEQVLATEPEVFQVFRLVLEKKFSAFRIRVHGDYHLGQVLFTGKDFKIIDFEGEPARSLGERRLKRSPLRDVAGMIRSFDYAVHSRLRRMAENGVVNEEELDRIAGWARYWHFWVSVAFVQDYLREARKGSYLPASQADLKTLLAVLLLEKAVYEVSYELNNRPDWLEIPAQGILGLLRRK